MLGTSKPRWARLNSELLTAVALILYIFLAACAGAPLRPLASRVPPDRTVQEDKIREAVFLYLIKTRGYQGSIFLNIDGKNPDDEFMACFTGSKPLVKKASGAYFKKEPFPGWLRDRSNGQKAVELSVGAISWFTATKVEVRGGSYCGGLCGDWGVFRVVKKNSEWTVEEYEVRAVS